EERAAVRTFVEERLRAGADLRIPTWNVAGCGEREPERHLRDGLPEDRADPEYVDPTLEAGGVVDVREEVAFDVEHGSQVRSTRDARGRDGSLPDDRQELWQEPIDELGRGRRPVMPGDGSK